MQKTNQQIDAEKQAFKEKILSYGLLYKCITGSRLYGTFRPDSDIDIRGVFIAPPEYYYGFLNKVETIETKSPDETFWELRQFMSLALANNHQILELLFTPTSHIISSSDTWETIKKNRDLFLSTRVIRTFSGYAASQLHRIKQHREWLLHPISRQPSRTDFGLPDNQSLVTKDQLNAFSGLQTHLGADLETAFHIDTNFIEILHREKAYQNALHHWNEYQDWKKNRNPIRHDLEAEFGYDTKHAAHLVRLVEEGMELLTTKQITFPRPESDELRRIINGVYSYDVLMEKYGDIDKLFQDIQDRIVLPQSPNAEAVDQLCCELSAREICRRQVKK